MKKINSLLTFATLSASLMVAFSVHSVEGAVLKCEAKKINSMHIRSDGLGVVDRIKALCVTKEVYKSNKEYWDLEKRGSHYGYQYEVNMNGIGASLRKDNTKFTINCPSVSQRKINSWIKEYRKHCSQYDYTQSGTIVFPNKCSGLGPVLGLGGKATVSVGVGVSGAAFVGRAGVCFMSGINIGVGAGASAGTLRIVDLKNAGESSIDIYD